MEMETVLKLTSILAIFLQSFFAFLVRNKKMLYKKEITSYLKNLYTWLPILSVTICGICFANSINGIPISIDLMDKKMVVHILSYTTLILSFFPVKILTELIINLRPSE